MLVILMNEETFLVYLPASNMLQISSIKSLSTLSLSTSLLNKRIVDLSRGGHQRNFGSSLELKFSKTFVEAAVIRCLSPVFCASNTQACNNSAASSSSDLARFSRLEAASSASPPYKASLNSKYWLSGAS